MPGLRLCSFPPAGFRVSEVSSSLLPRRLRSERRREDVSPDVGVGSEDVCARESASQILFLSKGSARRERKAFPKRCSREKGASPQHRLAGWGNQWKEALWRLGEWTVKTEKAKTTEFKKKKKGKYKLKFKHQVFSVSQI